MEERHMVFTTHNRVLADSLKLHPIRQCCCPKVYTSLTWAKRAVDALDGKLKDGEVAFIKSWPQEQS